MSGPIGSGRPWAALGAEVEVLAPSGRGDLVAFLDAALEARPGPFAEERLAAVAALSEGFLAEPLLKRDPAGTAVAFWMRRTATARLAEEFARRGGAEPGVVRVPVGRVLHVAPANVDTLFLYSWALAFLCGNANVVRLSRERGPLVDAMLAVLGRVAEAHEVLRAGDRFVTYAHDAEAGAALSAWCSHRVVWGGDETVAALRAIPLPAHASERSFGGKFSYSVFDAERWLAADAAARARVAGGFFNDLFWFDQMACSSPQLLFWVGSAEAFERATGAFDEALEAEVERRGFAVPAANAVHRRAFAFDLAASADVRVELGHPGFVSVRVRDARGLAREICGGGLLRHARLERLEDLAGFAREADQTVTHFGFEAGALLALAARLGARGVDRLVPVGEALAFDPVWDGFDLLDDFTRRVRVRTG